jgi:cytoskeleton protein RodZ
MPDASHDFGGHLKQAREQRGVSLRTIADRTKISVLALEALERNDVSRLPGGIFTRAFVRAYAAEVGLDPEDTVRRFLARFPDQTTEEETPKAYEANPNHIVVDERPTIGRAWRRVAWAIPLLLGVAYFGFGGRLPLWGEKAAQRPARAADAERPPSPPPPEELAASVPAKGLDESSATSLPAVEQAGAPAEAGAPPIPIELAGQTAPANTPLASGPATPSRDAAAAVPASEAEVPGDRAGAFRVTLAPREACWISVRVNGTSVFSGLMQPGERRSLDLHGRVSLTVGNAGAFDYFVNDQPGRSLGATGKVATVVMSADNLQSFVAGR